MTNLTTRLTQSLNIKYPMMSAPMSRHSGAGLAAAVTNAGGLGLFGALNAGREAWFTDEIAKAQQLLGDRPFGVGFITHLIESLPELFEIALRQRVPVIAFSFADPTHYIKRVKEAGLIAVCQVQNMAQASTVVAAGADILVAQGNEAGGHTGQSRLMPLLFEVLSAFPDLPVLAAGGIGTGRDLAAVLSAGADGAWIGTPLLATHECTEVSDEYKSRLIAAGTDDTLYTPLFDLANHGAFGGTPWPADIAARVIRNRFVEEWQDRMVDVNSANEALMSQYRLDVKNSNLDVSVVYAGESVGAVTSIRPVAEVITELCEGAALNLDRKN